MEEHDMYGDDEMDISIPATPEEADATRADWQDDSDPFALDAQDFDDPIEEKRRQLGFDLAWWGDISLLHGLDEIMGVVDAVVRQHDRAETLVEHGVSPDALAVPGPTLGIVNGPLVMGGLQILGIFAPQLRGDIERILSDLPNPRPTDEESEQIKAVSKKIVEAAAEGLRKTLAERGDTTTRVVSTKDELFEALDEIAEQTQDEQPRPDSNLN